MQTEIVITLSLYVLGAVLLAYTLFRAITTAHRRGYAAGETQAETKHTALLQYQTQATALAKLARDEILGKRATANMVIDELKDDMAQRVTVTPQEIGVLIQAANIIELAHRTWAPLKGVEPTARKASNVHQKLTELNTRLSERAQAAAQEQAA
ncbi:hypothetical protein N015_17310 [Pseudomonas asturiensis]|uniref:Uncharacterized protein n=1 Tax=Pseudomonas asturiensis TaxID=1190415 RepID=A0ABX6HEQ1_9PSED|nr:hypothetical protein [Pseudomonas asturiensis]QHF04072.1 hypothetical protein N015_17310 [Pseudomonas asturiensis]